MRKKLSLALLGGLLSGPCMAFAESPMSISPTIPPAAVASDESSTSAPAAVDVSSTPLTLDATTMPEVKSKITGTLSANYVTSYISRGIILEDQGAIVQPSIQLNFALIDDAGLFTNIYAYVGLWSSLHSHHEFAGNKSMADWYEFDYWGGVNATIANNLDVDLQYIVFTSPSDAFGTAKNVQLKFSYDDSGYLGAWSLHPYATFFQETDGKAGTGKDLGLYVELGIAPGKTFGSGDYPITVSLPITLGLGFSDFYGNANGDNETYGYSSIGVSASVPLAFIPAGYGTWSYSAGVYYYNMGSGVRAANAAAATDDVNEFLGVTGITINF